LIYLLKNDGIRKSRNYSYWLINENEEKINFEILKTLINVEKLNPYLPPKQNKFITSPEKSIDSIVCKVLMASDKVNKK
jgi:hypothetical protein